jgi:hypothetical protein
MPINYASPSDKDIPANDTSPRNKAQERALQAQKTALKNTVSQAALNDRGDSNTRPGINMDLSDNQTGFSGEGRIAQVTRWASSVAVSAARENSIRTPEVQSAFVGNRFLMGTNAADGNDAPLPGHMMQHLGREPQPITQDMSQEDRHLARLQKFVNAEPQNNPVIKRATGENNMKFIDPATGKFIDPKLNRDQFNAIKKESGQIRSTMTNMQTALQDGRIDMAAGAPNRHAEQRIFEHLQNNKEAELRASKISLGLPEDENARIPVIVAGTKPPCDMCETSELARDKVARDSPSFNTDKSNTLFIRRYEDPAYPKGPLFGKAHNPTDNPEIIAAIEGPGRVTGREIYPPSDIGAPKRTNSISEEPDLHTMRKGENGVVVPAPTAPARPAGNGQPNLNAAPAPALNRASSLPDLKASPTPQLTRTQSMPARTRS